MVDRIRLYYGATEIENYASAKYRKTSGSAIDTGVIEIEANSNVTSSTIIEFREDDGTSVVFSGRVEDIKESMTWQVDLFGKGSELTTRKIQKTYTNTSPEDIVKDLVDNYSDDLTFASTVTSGVTIELFIADGYVADVINDLITVMRWQARIDTDDKFYFEPQGYIDNSRILTDNVDGRALQWKSLKKTIVNHVLVKGGFENHLFEETVTGTGTEFSLAQKPEGSFQAVVSGSIVDPDDYDVDAENKTVTFTSSKTNPTLTYTYNRPVQAEYQDDQSINTYKRRYKALEAPWINNLSDVRRYAREYVQEYKDPGVECVFVMPGFDFTISEGERVRVVDGRRGKDENLVVKVIEYDARNMQTLLTLGRRTPLIGDFNSEVQYRIKQLERRFLNNPNQVFSRLISAGLKCQLTPTFTHYYASPQDTFSLSHQTLFWLKGSDKEDEECDCSSNGRYGVWQGTGIGGSQFSTSTVWRCASGYFNGTDNYVRQAGSHGYATTGYTIFLAFLNPDISQSGKVMYAESSSTDADPHIIISTGAGAIKNKVRVQIVDDTGDVLLDQESTTTHDEDEWNTVCFTDNNGTCELYINGVADSADFDYTPDTITLDRTSVGALWKSTVTNHYTGYLDEVRVYSKVLSEDEITDVNNKIQVNGSLELYWSMDNPMLGRNYSSTVSI